MSKRDILTPVLLFFLIFSINSFAQSKTTTSPNKVKSLFFDAYIGTQVSGIRKEDYVSSNFAPYFQLSIGKILTDKLSVNINFQGPYFNFIGDNHKHTYQFVGSDLYLSISKLLDETYCGKWNLSIFIGSGLLFNNYSDKANLCLTGGIINEFRYKTIGIKFKASAITGLKIYQHDKDALTSISVGISKYF